MGRLSLRALWQLPVLLLVLLLLLVDMPASGAAQDSSSSSTGLALPRFRSPSPPSKATAAGSASEAAAAGAAGEGKGADGKGRWDLRAFQSFLQARTGTSGHCPPSLARECYWVMQGQLSNPFTGDVIAAVRGVEVVKLVGSGALPCQALPGTKKALQLSGSGSGTRADAGAGAGADAGAGPGQWRAVACVLSAKSFRYFHPLTGQPLRTFRPSPRAKPRAVPPALTSLQAVTYALSRHGHLQLVSESVNGGLLSVRDEGKGPGAAPAPAGGAGGNGGNPQRRLVPWSWPSLPLLLRRAPRRFELSLLMWPGSKQKPQRGGEDKDGGGLAGIPWSSLVQFGASSSQPACRELYALSTEPARGQSGRRPRMRYLRYGECPHWCGAGRVCHLTLEGVRYDRLQDIPRADRRLFFPAAEQQQQQQQQRRQDEKDPAAVAGTSPPPLPLTTHDFADEQERERRRRRKRFIFF